MKKRRIVCLLLLISLIVTTLSGAIIYAESDSQLQATESYANQIINDGVTYHFTAQIPLKSSTGEVEYSFYSMSPQGFVIYNEVTARFEELAPYAVGMPYTSSANGVRKDYYYLGPDNYFYLDDGVYKDCITNEALTTGNLTTLIQIESVKRSAEASLSTASSSDERTVSYSIARGPIPIIRVVNYYIPNENYFTSLLGNYFGLNVNGTCTMVASQILLGYYNYYSGLNVFIDSQYCDGYGTTESFHQLMINYIKPSGGGAFFSEATNGINAYLDTRSGVTVDAHLVTSGHSGVFNVVSRKIREGYPVATAMFSWYNSDCPMNHANITYGYSMIYSNQTGELDGIYYYVHNGWKNSSSNLKSYNYAWFAHAIYLE